MKSKRLVKVFSIVVAFQILLILPLFAADNKAKSRELSGEAFEFILSNPDKAIELTVSAIELDPQNADAYLYRGQAKYWKGNANGAINDLSEAKALMPDSYEPYLYFGKIYFEKGNLPKAVDYYKNAEALCSGYENDILRALGRTYYYSEDYSAAISVYNDFLKTEPDDSIAKGMRALSYFRNGDYLKAETEFRELGSSFYLYLVNRAQGDAQEAEEYMTTAIAMNPKYQVIPQIESYTESLSESTANKAQIYYRRSELYKEISEFDFALFDLDKAIQIDQDYADAYRLRAEINAILRMPIRSMSDIDKAISLSPDDAKYRVSKGFIYYYFKAYEDAIDSCNYALKLDIKESDAYKYIAHSYHKLGNYEKLFEILTQSIEQFPDDHSFYMIRGFYYSTIDETSKAKQDLEKALELAQEEDLKAAIRNMLDKLK